MSLTNEAQSSTLDPPPFDPLQPSIPVSYPLKTLKELESRSYFKSFHYPFNKSSVSLKSSGLDNRPRILVCHDMQGGYVDDKWVQGGNNKSAYAIWHWYLIDVFVYFSHNLVTLPPPCWTNTAHRHGVKVLGTFITEGSDGTETCNKLLATKESAHMYAERLAELAADLGFDGWLMNIEVELEAKQIPNLKEFVSHLTQIMHSTVPGSLVIWYDSVTVNGRLIYQNQLNENNKPFFDICDGIFANYWWAKDYPKNSAVVAGDRKFDVYMGVDVFGRGTYGGGEWNTNVALDVCKKADVSAAIFAPGWVYETKQPPDFQTAQNKWWSLVEKSCGVVKSYPNTLPFYSNFDQGHGYHFSVEGGQVSNAPWNNISSQGLQPFLEFNKNQTTDTIQVLADFKEASYSGGANITFKGTLKDHNDFTARLFQGRLLLGELPLHMTYSVKSDGDSQIGLCLYFSSTLNKRTSVFIAPCGKSQFSNEFSKVIVPHRLDKPEMAPGWVIQESSIDMNGYTLTEIHALCYRSKPEHGKLRSEYISDRHDNTTGPSPSEYFAVLGHITIKNSKENPVFPASSSWLVAGQCIKWISGSQGSKKLSIKISWKLKDGSTSQFSKFNIYVEKLGKNAGRNSDGRIEGIQEFIGVACVETFYVSCLSIPCSTSSVKFIIQMCGIDGTCQKLVDSPLFLLDVEASHQVAIPISNYGETDSLNTSQADTNHGRRFIKNNDYKASKPWGNSIWYGLSIKGRATYVAVDLLQRVGKMDRQIIIGRLKQTGLSWLLMVSLVLFGTSLWVLNNIVVKNIGGNMHLQ
ncbi:cytosolic endo-beta-N-acetylglucosaminidase 1 [Ricinus communis]|uniref:cytosolic endo-beta-N-acetylglucosaminidase 1 n=1 Tax=Ricinus communis TaxID=3988 RepID=UPI00201AD61E|nr:cytosolic endo-beta-N-acetylglucosaminidase 1 [Ricinus communis]